MTPEKYKEGFNDINNGEWIWGHAQTRKCQMQVMLSIIWMYLHQEVITTALWLILILKSCLIPMISDLNYSHGMAFGKRRIVEIC
jgi:hypothetical protein